MKDFIQYFIAFISVCFAFFTPYIVCLLLGVPVHTIELFYTVYIALGIPALFVSGVYFSVMLNSKA